MKEIDPQQAQFSWELDAEPAAIPYTRRYDLKQPFLKDAVIPRPFSIFSEKKQRRRSRNIGFAKQYKSESDLRLKMRRSLFGAKAGASEDVLKAPELPCPAYLQSQYALNPSPVVNGVRQGIAVTSDNSVSWYEPTSPSPDAEVKKERRKSVFGSRKHSKSSAFPMNRWSLFGGNKAIEDPALPIPSMPVIAINRDPGNTSLLEVHQGLENQKLLSRVFSQRRSQSHASIRKMRRSWFLSSNPDSSDDEEPPPIPALIFDNGSVTRTSSLPTSRTPPQPDPIDSSTFTYSAARLVVHVGSIKQPRPVSGGTSSGSHRFFVPKNPANGFLKSTTPNTRSTFRHSLLDDGDGDMVCLSEEQQREWEKLKHLMDVLERRKDQHVVSTFREVGELDARQGRTLFENAEALAALEFGIAR